MLNRERYSTPEESLSAFNTYCREHTDDMGECYADVCKCNQHEPSRCYFEWMNLENEATTNAFEEWDIIIDENTPDIVNHPNHYSSGNIECIEAIKGSMSEEAYKGFLKGNVMKYIWRYEKKVAPAEDLKKAKWYLEKLIEEVN